MGETTLLAAIQKFLKHIALTGLRKRLSERDETQGIPYNSEVNVKEIEWMYLLYSL